MFGGGVSSPTSWGQSSISNILLNYERTSLKQPIITQWLTQTQTLLVPCALAELQHLLTCGGEGSSGTKVWPKGDLEICELSVGPGTQGSSSFSVLQLLIYLC